MKTEEENGNIAKPMLVVVKPTIHLIGDILTTVCGRQLEVVNWEGDKNKATCKSCIKQIHPTYPTRVR